MEHKDLLNIKKNIFIAFYLPQFYDTEENNKFWYKGFTDWDKIKKSKPLYKNHNQPRIPYNYYDLSEQNVIDKQIKTAKEYGIDGFCFYHYSFDINKHYLSRPVENFVKSKNKLNFCLCWVNTDWRRTWDGSNILLEKQQYNEKHLEELINYYTKFDTRYYYYNNKPVFIIYDINNVPIYYLEKIKNHFSIIAIDKDIDKNKLYFIENIIDWPIENIKRLFCDKNRLDIIDYNEVCSYTKDNLNNKIPNILLEFDNTPRYGEKGIVFNNFTLTALEETIKYCTKNNIIFINAWNEWAEGMTLEPDKKRDYDILKIIKKYATDI